MIPPIIPRTLHFCFGLSPDFGGKPWSLVHHACVRRAVEVLRPDRVLFHHEFEPTGPWWRLTRPLVTLVKVTAPVEVFGNPLRNVAHRADVLRLRILLEHGGIYLDADVFAHRAFDDLLGHPLVLAEEGPGDRVAGLCNAVILAAPGSAFLGRWHDHYRSFRSQGMDEFWTEHSVHLPLKLQRQHPAEVHVLPATAFYRPYCDAEGLAQLYDPGGRFDIGTSHATHLWESLRWWQNLRDLTPGRVRREDSVLHRWLRPLVADLPDRYGAPTPLELARRKLRHLAGQASRRLGRG